MKVKPVTLAQIRVWKYLNLLHLNHHDVRNLRPGVRLCMDADSIAEFTKLNIRGVNNVLNYFFAAGLVERHEGMGRKKYLYNFPVNAGELQLYKRLSDASDLADAREAAGTLTACWLDNAAAREALRKSDSLEIAKDIARRKYSAELFTERLGDPGRLKAPQGMFRLIQPDLSGASTEMDDEGRCDDESQYIDDFKNLPDAVDRAKSSEVAHFVYDETGRLMYPR